MFGKNTQTFRFTLAISEWSNLPAVFWAYNIRQIRLSGFSDYAVSAVYQSNSRCPQGFE
jgi:hypothetical protein